MQGYRKTFRHFYNRAAEHMGISNLTWKHVKNVKQSIIFHHLLQRNRTINFDDFNILATDSDKLYLLLRDRLLIKCDKSISNGTIKSFPLELIYQNDSFISKITWLSDFFLVYNIIILLYALAELGYVLKC